MLNLNRSPSRFSERETQKYCDAEDALYRSFWDGFLRACSRPNAIMLENSGIDGTVWALAPGRDNGNTAKWRCCPTITHVGGIDSAGRASPTPSSPSKTFLSWPASGVPQGFSHRTPRDLPAHLRRS